MRLDLLAALNAARAERRAAAVVTEMPGGAQRVVTEAAGDPLAGPLAKAFASGRSCMIDAGERSAFINVHLPATRLVILGAVHVGQTLAPIAAALDYDVTVVDPRTAFATAERFSGVSLVADWPDRALPEMRLDRYTAFAALTHDPKIDDPGLIEALRAGCFYVGALGSRKTHAARRERLLAAGLAEAEIDRIKAPIGLAIGAASPAEIAISIMAEITAELRRPVAA
ncbi:XdhC family protein [Chelatococcus sambhunathii]|uniref:XdhC family protein n=1 Tax=Chelatococcus sambhunathii TaxID=363953 RepID=A0ABU1DL19_9HYPH|nr:XdhC family protein [Chelatococcus sambhunathii]MDR4308806.1 XdhC family protein [Chelatococcus sambhunathii]